MDRDKLKTLGQKTKQRQISRAPKQPAKANSAKKRQNKVVNQENIDTVPQKSKNWLIPGILAAGLLAVTTAGIGWQLRAPTKEETASTAVTETASPSNNAPGAISSADKEREGQMLLEQAKLLANQGQPQQLAQAIQITKKLSPNTTVSAQAQSLIAIWSQKILQEANSKASTGKLNEAIAVAKLVPDKTPNYQQAQQQIKQWEQQQYQAKQQQFAATLAEVSRPLPPPPTVAVIPPPPPTVAVIPPPPSLTTSPVVSESAAPAKSINPKSQPESKGQTLVTNSPATTSINQNPSKVVPLSQPKTADNQGQLLAQDPYLKVTIPQVNVPQLQPKNVRSPQIASNGNHGRLSNNYGFRNLTVHAATVAIQLRDNVDEDGDYVSLIVNGKPYANNQLILNHGQVIMVDLQPGENRVDVIGIKDGTGGITLEVNVAGIGNINNRPIPEGSTASFIINRAK